MLTTSARLLKLLSLLQARRFWSGADLARELGVTERSVRRDVDRLRDLGYPVHAAAGVGGGYALGAGADLPPLPLEDDEAVAVALGLRAAVAGPVRGYEQAALRALAKLEQVLPERLRGRVGALQAVSVRLGGDASLDGAVLLAAASACGESRVLHFTYRDRSAARSERAVEPHRLVHSAHRWYLVAWDRGRRDWRTFRVDRIAEPRPAERFRPRPPPAEDLAEWVERRVSSADAWRHVLRVRLGVDLEHARRRLGPGADLTPDGTGCVLETSADDLDGAASYLLSFGWEVEVIEPPGLRDALRRLSERAARASFSPGTG